MAFLSGRDVVSQRPLRDDGHFCLNGYTDMTLKMYRNRSIYTETRRQSPDWSVFSAEEAVFVLVYSYPGAKGQAHLHSSMQASGIQQA